MIVDPVTIEPERRISEALEVMRSFRISGIPVTSHGKLVGILTNRDIRFAVDEDRPVSELMTRERLVTVPVGTTLEQAREILHRSKIEKLPVVDDHNMLKGLITMKDIQKKIMYPHAAKDKYGRLRVAAAVGIGPDCLKRCSALIEEGVDAIVVDTSHGHSQMVVETVARIHDQFGRKVQLVAGNVVTAGATEALIQAGADAVKVGIGGGSICTTRISTSIRPTNISCFPRWASAPWRSAAPPGCSFVTWWIGIRAVRPSRNGTRLRTGWSARERWERATSRRRPASRFKPS